MISPLNFFSYDQSSGELWLHSIAVSTTAEALARHNKFAAINNAVRWHHKPERNKNSTTKSDMVYLSNLMYQPRGDSDSADGQFISPSSIVLDRLGIKLEQYKVIAEKALNWMKKLSDTLTFD